MEIQVMKTAKLAINALFICLALSGSAKAQFVVSDPVTETETLTTALNTAANLEQLITMVTMLTAPFAVTGILSALDQKNQYPSAGELDKEMFSPKTPASTNARTITLDADRAVVGDDAEANLCAGRSQEPQTRPVSQLIIWMQWTSALRQTRKHRPSSPAHAISWRPPSPTACFSNRSMTQLFKTFRRPAF